MSLLDQWRYCPTCAQRLPVTDEWKFPGHYVGELRCTGSGTPAERPEPSQRRHGSRWR